MTEIRRYVGPLRTEALGPEDLRLAADAFEAALYALDETTDDIDPYMARQAIARSIMESVLRGERDPDQLTELALRDFARAISAGYWSAPGRRVS